jgi:septal ring factor EnvC (AmiA/AmiB activator)
VKKLGESVSKLQARVTEVEKDKASVTRERDALTKERDELKVKVAEQQVGNATLARQIIKLEERAKAAARERTELVERPRDAEPDQAAPAATAATAATAAKADAATADAGTASTPPTGPTGIVIQRLAFGGNLPPASSPKTGPPSIGILGQNHRSPIRGGANKKHKRR